MLPPGVDMKQHYKWDSFTGTLRQLLGLFYTWIEMRSNINNLLLFLIISSSKSHKHMSSPEFTPGHLSLAGVEPQ